LKLTSEALKLDLPSVEARIKRFIRDYVEKCGANGVVLGVSGGLDSCTTAALASLSLGVVRCWISRCLKKRRMTPLIFSTQN
jgi:NH3-dependent NAD+ synthetase